MAGGLFQIPAAVQRQRIPQLLELVGLSKLPVKAAAPVFQGMLQRVMAQALINDPELVFLDEPMSGLDPLGAPPNAEIILFKTRQDDFFNSHILSEVEQICSRVPRSRRVDLQRLPR